MKKYSTRLVLISTFVFGLMIVPSSAQSQLFGADDEDLAKIEFELKKFNTHLEQLKRTEIVSLREQQENLVRQIENILQILPGLQGTVEQNKSETLSGLNKTNAKLDDLAAEVNNQVLNKIHQQNMILEQFRLDQESIKTVLTQKLIPALRNENNITRQTMLEEIEKLKFSQNRLEGKLDEILRKTNHEKIEPLDKYK